MLSPLYSKESQYSERLSDLMKHRQLIHETVLLGFQAQHCCQPVPTVRDCCNEASLQRSAEAGKCLVMFGVQCSQILLPSGVSSHNFLLWVVMWPIVISLLFAPQLVTSLQPPSLLLLCFSMSIYSKLSTAPVFLSEHCSEDSMS